MSPTRLQLSPVLVIRLKVIKCIGVLVAVSDRRSLSESRTGQRALLAGGRVDLSSDSVQGSHTKGIGSSRCGEPSRVVERMQRGLTTDDGVVVVTRV